MIHKHQAEALANLLAALRPNDWRPKQVLDVLEEHRETTHPFVVIAEVAIRAAKNPVIKSPTGIFLPGKHWEVENYAAKLPPAPDCPDHIGKPAHNCASCWADVKAGDRLPQQIGKRLHPEPDPALIRRIGRPTEADLQPEQDAA